MTKTLTLLQRVVKTLIDISFKASNTLLHQVIIGQLLGGANVTRRSPTRNSYFRCGFGTTFETYGAWVCNFFDSLTNKGLTSRKNRGFGGSYILYEFQTKTLPIFNYYHSLFYTLESGKYIKIVPLNILDLMSPIVLAHLLMSSGHFSTAKNIIEINTYAFTYNDCVRLANSINNLHSLLRRTAAVTVIKERIGKDGRDQYYLCISGPAAKVVIRELVRPHMYGSMLYRVGL